MSLLTRLAACERVLAQPAWLFLTVVQKPRARLDSPTTPLLTLTRSADVPSPGEPRPKQETESRVSHVASSVIRTRRVPHCLTVAHVQSERLST